MPIPRVAIVGRPNVGKSSLLNMIAGAKVSIVDPTPGVTRDRVAVVVDLVSPDGRGPIKSVEFVDTGGYGVYVADGERYDEVGNDLANLTSGIEEQIAAAIANADLILFAIDTQAGVTPADEEIAQLLRERRLGPRGKTADPTRKPPPVRMVATKVDGPSWEPHAFELSALGLGDPIVVSAKTNFFRRDFLDTIYNTVPQYVGDPTPPSDLFIAIIGKRNAGKSTLVNAIAGEPRVIVSEIPGTTRDAIDVRVERDGKSLTVIDTAGLRKKKSFQNMIEHYAYDRLQRAVDRADVVMLLVDATEPISQVDEQCAMLAQKAFKPTIIVVNKWDLVEGRKDHKGRNITTRTYETYLRDELRGLPYAPIAFVSADQGRNVKETIGLAFDLNEQARDRVTTGRLNRLVRGILDKRGPTDIKGTFAKVYYVAQTGVQPPTITLVVNHPRLFTPNYLRFLMNRFREELPFAEVPIRIIVRERRQREDDMSTAGENSEDGPVRIRAGRKGVARGRPGAPLGNVGGTGEEPLDEMGEELLSDFHSDPVEIDMYSEDVKDYFDPELEDDEKA